MQARRRQRFEEVVGRRQFDLTVVLENVHDPHNIGAVLRSCDSVGISEVFVLYTEPQLDRDHLELGRRAAGGAQKWVDVNFYTEIAPCFEHLRSRYDRIYSTHLSDEATELFDLQLSGSVALVFGNEHDGVSEEVRRRTDGDFIIPQVGMSQSLNISVACAVTLYEAFRQRRRKKGFFRPLSEWTEKRRSLLQKYLDRHSRRMVKRKVFRFRR